MSTTAWHVYVDPGKHASGVAWFSHGVLQHVEYRVEPLAGVYGHFTTLAWCEKPVVRRGSNVRPADLIDLAIAAGRMCGAIHATTYITPESWKGQIPCTCTATTVPANCTHHRRMVRALTVAEMALVKAVQNCPPALLHNAYDAVTMGLKLEGRLC